MRRIIRLDISGLGKPQDGEKIKCPCNHTVQIHELVEISHHDKDDRRGGLLHDGINRGS
jgi:hypothetical protein